VAVGLYITLRQVDGSVVGEIPDPLGGTFDASGDFDELLGRGRSPILDAIDPHGETTLTGPGLLTDLTAEIDALVAGIPDSARGSGRQGAAWRGLVRFRTMISVCASSEGLTLHFLGD
jgi:hypothetical protein